MEFTIDQQIFDEDGDYLEEEGRQYQDELFALFEASPEAQKLKDENVGPHWTAVFLDYAISYQGVAPPHITTDDLEEVLFDVLPRKLSAVAEEAPAIIRELRLFWTFLGREFQLQNAADCLQFLNEEAAQRLQEAMSNPANFGIAKSFVMEGYEHGFDMTDEEEIQKWMLTYNAEMASKRPSPFSLPGLLNSSGKSPFTIVEPGSSFANLESESPLTIVDSESPFALSGRSGSSRKSRADKNRRKMVKRSRKQNRKR